MRFHIYIIIFCHNNNNNILYLYWTFQNQSALQMLLHNRMNTAQHCTKCLLQQRKRSSDALSYMISITTNAVQEPERCTVAPASNLQQRDRKCLMHTASVSTDPSQPKQLQWHPGLCNSTGGINVILSKDMHSFGALMMLVSAV